MLAGPQKPPPAAFVLWVRTSHCTPIICTLTGAVLSLMIDSHECSRVIETL